MWYTHRATPAWRKGLLLSTWCLPCSLNMAAVSRQPIMPSDRSILLAGHHCRAAHARQCARVCPDTGLHCSCWHMHEMRRPRTSLDSARGSLPGRHGYTNMGTPTWVQQPAPPFLIVWTHGFSPCKSGRLSSTHLGLALDWPWDCLPADTGYLPQGQAWGKYVRKRKQVGR